jgi:hypothetical protein
MVKRALCYASAAAMFAAMIASASAQQAPPPGGVAPAGPPVGVRALPALPSGLDPLSASPTAKRQYGLPPEPDAAAAPEIHAKWVKAVAALAKPREAPTIRQSNIFNGPIQQVGGAGPGNEANVTKSTSYNWSGTAFTSKKTPWNLEAIIGEMTVPVPQQAFGACTGGWDYSSFWPGIDGWGSNDVLQAGIEVDAYCNGGSTDSAYGVWVEWYPYSESPVGQPTISPGDLIYIEVWNVSPTQGYAEIWNETTNSGGYEYALSAPPGTTLVGNSIEWIAERPGVNGGLATLMNYTFSAWPYGIAWNYAAKKATNYWQGGKPAAGFALITMLDGNGAGISAPAIENSDFVWDYNYGSSR